MPDNVKTQWCGPALTGEDLEWILLGVWSCGRLYRQLGDCDDPPPLPLPENLERQISAEERAEFYRFAAGKFTHLYERLELIQETVEQAFDKGDQ